MVKADGYGHGAVPVALAVVNAGASNLAVALVEEGVELRQAGIEVPILVLSEARGSMIEAVRAGLTPTLYTETGVAEAEAAAATSGQTIEVELLVDTGMRRVGAEPHELAGLVTAIQASSHLRLGGIWSHCAVADEPDHPFTDRQFERFASVWADVGGEGIRRHVGNSAVALDHTDQAFDMVRCGISVYGIPPAPMLSDRLDLEPALSLRSEVSFVKRVRAGEGVSYGHHWHAPSDRWIATVPIGYADGVRRELGLRTGDVLIGGRRRPIVGVVTMDQLMVDLDQDDSVAAGDEVVLIGRQGDEQITATDIAERLGTIAYEVVCAIGPRVPRRYV